MSKINNKNKKRLAVLSSAALGVLIASAVTTSVSAKVTSYIVNDNGKVISFASDDLIADYTNKLLGKASPMFDAYLEKVAGLTAFQDSVKGYVSYESVLEAYQQALLIGQGNSFDIDSVTENAGAEDIKDITVGYEWKDGAVTPVDQSKVITSVDTITVPATTVGTVPTLPTTVNVTLGDGTTKAANITWNEAATSADTYATAGTVTINGTLADYDNYAVSASVTVNPTELTVSSVSAINATQVKVEFTQAVDKTDAETVARYTINNITPTTASLGTDEKTVTLTFALPASVEVTAQVLIVEPVKSKADTTITNPRYTQIFTYKDEVKPTIASVESKTSGSVATTVTVKASEPIASALAKIDGTYYVIAFGGTDTATITGLSLDKTKTHTLELVNLTDKATTPNVTVLASQTFSIVTDTVAPTATLSQKTDKTILVTFDKSMDVASVQAALAAGTTAVKDEAFAGVTTGVATVVANTDNKQFTIAITPALYTNTTSRTLTVIFPNTIKDSLGNAMATTTKQITLTKDVTAPVATGYKIIKNASGQVTNLEVNFSEELAASGAVTSPVIVDSNGVVVTGTLLGGINGSIVSAGDKKITYTFTTPAKVSGVYNFSFPANLVTDGAETPNQSAVFNYNVDFGTSTGTFDLTSATAVADVITVTYPVAVKGGTIANSATDVNNYSLAGKPLPAGTTITLNAAQTVATITLPADGVATSDAAAAFTVANVKSLTGDTVNSYTGTVAVDDNTKPVLTSAVLNTNGSITLGFSETLDIPTVVGDYTIRLNGKAVDDSQVTTITAGTGSEAGKYVIPSFVATYDAGAGVAGDGDETVFIDLTADGLTADDIILQTGTIASLAASNYATGVVGGKDAAISTITVTTDAVATGADAATNVIKAGTTITVK